MHSTCPWIGHSQRPPLLVPAGCGLALPVPAGVVPGAVVTRVTRSAQWKAMQISPRLAAFPLPFQGAEAPRAPIRRLPAPPLPVPRLLPFSPSVRRSAHRRAPLPALRCSGPGSQHGSARPAHGVGAGRQNEPCCALFGVSAELSMLRCPAVSCLCH